MLHEYVEVFAWSYEDMSGLDTDIVVHRLPLKEDCKIPGELAKLLIQEEKVIQPHEEPVEMVNLGTGEDKKEVKIGANLEYNRTPKFPSHFSRIFSQYLYWVKTAQGLISSRYFLKTRV